MLQYLLLPVEVVLFFATAYLFWNTRKLAESASEPPLVQPDWPQNQSAVKQMAQDVAQLVTDLQAVAGATRDDLLRQRTELQTLLSQAETLAGELRTLMEQAEANPPVAAVYTEPSPVAPNSPAPPAGSATELVPLELVYSSSQFGEFLRDSGCGHDVVSVASQHAQEFIMWFASRFEDEPVPGQVEPHWLDEYLAHLETNGVNPNTIQRRFVALKAYVNWANHRDDMADTEPDEPAPAPEPLAEEDTSWDERNALLSPLAPEPAVAKEPLSTGLDRYRTVFSLADQGIDQLTIAAKTGLEQETVRMMLVMGQAAYAS